VPCVALVELAEIFVWANDRRRARQLSRYAGLSPDEAIPLDPDYLSDAEVEASGPGSGAP